MVSHEGFRILGCVYAILDTLGSLISTIQGAFLIGSKTVDETVQYTSLPGSLISLIFGIILLVGIWEKNLTYVKVFRIYFIVICGITVTALSIFIVVLIGMMIFANGDNFLHSIVVFYVLLVLGFVIGFYKLTMWIVNGVIDAIQNEKGADNDWLYKPDANVRPLNPCNVPV